mmetsp:Transcript_30546/g.63788  ORF Transcript_30546/g.63788 Transcript_30546/m.63788 type:complete len:230 (-) Transcript_30546:717-1406(-)
MTSSILRIILTTCAASCNCCCLPINVSKTPISCISMEWYPSSLASRSTPSPMYGLFSFTCRDLAAATSSMGEYPEFSANAKGISSKALAKARMAYWSTPVTVSAYLFTAKAHAISADPPPYTTRLSRMRLRTTHMASCNDRLASSTIMLFPPRTKTVTAVVFVGCSKTIMRSPLVVPKDNSCTRPACPNLSADKSSKRATMRPPVAMAMCSISTPPTHRTAGRSFCKSK